MAGILGAALLVLGWWSARREPRLRGDELRRLRHIADSRHREQAQRFD